MNESWTGPGPWARPTRTNLRIAVRNAAAQFGVQLLVGGAGALHFGAGLVRERRAPFGGGGGVR